MRSQPNRWQLGLPLLLIMIAACVGGTLAKSTAGKLPKKFDATVHDRPVKGPKSLLQRFPIETLSADDVGFLKALDKQFAKYGNVKIKVENVTQPQASNGAGKKRTINNDLGYGYHGQSHQAESGYSFSAPKFQIYPYSQHDIPPLPSYQQHQQQPQQHHYGERVVAHSIQIEPSLSFELKSTPYGYENVNAHQQQPAQQYQYQQQQQQQHQQQPEVPVIVLRIPGPHKYAAHLQALLQQYLELRAAEYIHAAQLQEQEQGQEHEQREIDEPQQYQHQEQQQHYQPQPQQHYQQQQQQYIYQTPQFVDTDDHSQQQHYAPQAQAQHSAEEDYSEDSYQPTAISHQNHHHNTQVYGVPAAGHQDASHLPIQENYPSRLHTRVVYTGHGSHTGASYYATGQHSHRTEAGAHDYHSGAGAAHQGQRPFIYAYQQEHPQQQQEQHDQEHEQPEPTAVGHYAHEQMAQLSGGYEQAEEPAAQHQQHDQEYAPIDPNQVSITHRPETSGGDGGGYVSSGNAEADAEEHTHSPHDRPYNYHAHGAGNEHQHQAADVHERAASRYQ